MAQGRSPRRSGRVPVRIGDKVYLAEPFEKIELDLANAQADRAISKVKEVEPNWKPARRLDSNSVRAAIDRSKDVVLEAEARLIRHGRQTHQSLIDIYREQHRSIDLFGNDGFDREKNVVAYGMDNGMPLFGTNSKAPPYQDIDRSEASRMLRTLIEVNPDKMKRDNIGQKPNNAIRHAEATVLMRMARANGGTLRGREITIYVERAPCPSCEIVLPLLSRELGEPTVTFVDLRTGNQQTIRNGDWD